MGNKRIKSSISFGLSLGYAALHCVLRDAETAADVYRTLSDGFTVPGLMCIFAGLLSWLSGEGAFDGVGYVLGNAARLLLFQGRRTYQEARREKKSTGCGFLFVTGAVCLAAAGVFTVLFYR